MELLFLNVKNILLFKNITFKNQTFILKVIKCVFYLEMKIFVKKESKC